MGPKKNKGSVEYDESVVAQQRQRNVQELRERDTQKDLQRHVKNATAGHYVDVFVKGFPKGYLAKHLLLCLWEQLGKAGLEDADQHIMKVLVATDRGGGGSRQEGYVSMTRHSAELLRGLWEKKQLVFGSLPCLKVEVRTHEPNLDEVDAGSVLSFNGGTAMLGGWSGPKALTVQWEETVDKIVLEGWKQRLSWFYSHGGSSYKVQVFKKYDPREAAEKHWEETDSEGEAGEEEEHGARYVWKRQVDTDSHLWRRSTDFTASNSIGQCLVHRLHVGCGPRQLLQVDAVLRELGVLQRDAGYTLTLTQQRPDDFATVHVKAEDWRKQRMKLRKQHNLSFRVVYALELLVTRAKVSSYELLPESDVWSLLSAVDEHTALCVLESFEGAYVAHNRSVRTEPEFALRLREVLGKKDTIVKVASAAKLTPEHLGNHVLVRKAIVTPTRICVLPAELDLSNRVVRMKRFKDKPDSLIRVVFADEEFDRPMHMEFRRSVRHRFREVLRNGLHIAGEEFKFLGFSSSQLRQRSTWFCDDNPGAVLRSMGNFDAITNPARCAARIGQCLSGTTKYGDLKKHEWTKIPDVTVPGKPHFVFSDGVGHISYTMADQLCTHLGITSGIIPSAYQVRFGGAKGVLCIQFPMARPSPGAGDVHVSVRDSMVKFHTTENELEVITYSRWMPAYLNRQLVTILETLGVPREVFGRLQEEYLERLDRMLVNRRAAINMVKTMGGGSAAANQMLSMLEAGFGPDNEEFVRDMLCAMYSCAALEVQRKARVLIRDGAILMGVMDERAYLEYGQVFVRVRPTPMDRPRVITGPVLVSKSPMMHPGDVRMLMAVECPDLEHMATIGLENVIAFPQKGPRPHPNEMAGSDLDGDLYIAIWDERLFPKHVADPMEFPKKEKEPPNTRGGQVSQHQIQDFFLRYMRKDNLGQISHSHLAIADRSREGVNDGRCIVLAQLAAVAVDFAKTGKEANIREAAAKYGLSYRDLMPKAYPDFMEKENKPSYPSQKALGCMFRAMLNRTAVNPSVREWHHCDGDLKVPGSEAYLAEAHLLRDAYELDLWRILTLYSLKSESEAVSGFVPSLLTKEHKKKHSEVQEKLAIEIGALTEHYLRRFWSDLRERTHLGKPKKPGTSTPPSGSVGGPWSDPRLQAHPINIDDLVDMNIFATTGAADDAFANPPAENPTTQRPQREGLGRQESRESVGSQSSERSAEDRWGGGGEGTSNGGGGSESANGSAWAEDYDYRADAERERARGRARGGGRGGVSGGGGTGWGDVGSGGGWGGGGWGGGASTGTGWGDKVWGFELTGPKADTNAQSEEEKWEARKKASAWYQVCYDRASQYHWRSFPWVVTSILCDIKKDARRAKARSNPAPTTSHSNLPPRHANSNGPPPRGRGRGGVGGQVQRGRGGRGGSANGRYGYS